MNTISDNARQATEKILHALRNGFSGYVVEQHVQFAITTATADKDAVIERLVKIIEATPLEHTRDCPFDDNGHSPESDYCECFLKERRKNTVEALAEYDALHPEEKRK